MTLRRRPSIAMCLSAALTGALLSTAASAQTGAPRIDLDRIERELRLEAIETFLDDSWPLAEDGEVLPFAEAEIFFEQNATDGDLGIHFTLDGEPWRRVMIFDSLFRRFMTLRAHGNQGENGVTSLFSESAEPGFDEVPPEEFLSWFPEGEYLMVGVTTEGDLLASLATLTHDLPAEPEAVYPEEDDVVPFDEPLVIEWLPVPDPDAPDSVIIAYQVIVTQVADEGFEPEVVIDLPKTATCVTIPIEFLEPGREYKYEVLARETSGNQTITEVPFSTEER